MIIDRASPTIRSIRREALSADAAVEKLGLDLDRLGSQQRLSKVQNASRTVKAFGRDAESAGDRASKSFRNLHNEMDRGESRWRRLRTGIRGLKSDLFAIAKPGGLILKFGVGLGVAAQGIGALSGGVVGLIPRLVDLGGALAPIGVGMVGLGATLGTVALGFGGISAAVQGTKGAMASLTPQAARLAVQLRNLRPLLRDFRRSAGGGDNGLLAGASFAIRRLRSPQVSGTINNILRQTSTSLGGIERQATNRLTTPGALGDITQLAGTGNSVVRQGAEGILNLGDALRHVLVAAQPFTRWLSSTILLWTRHLDIVAKNARESGRLAQFFDRTRVSLTNMGHILRNVWQTFRNLGRDARPLGDDLWKAAERTTAGWARVTSSIDSRTGLTRQFMQMGHAIKSIFDLVGELGQAIFRMGSSPQLGRTVDNLRGLVPALERILTTMANTFGPGMAATLTSFGNLVADLTAGSTGPFTLLLDVLDKTFRLLDGILKVAGPLKGVFTEAFSLAIMARFLSRLGLIELGWRRVAAAAGAAAVAEGVAESGGGPGFGVGPGRLFGGRGGGGGGLRARLFSRGVNDAELLAGESRFVPGLTPGLLRAGGLARFGGAAGLGAAAGRGALAIGAKFALPLLAIQGAFGALTTQRSGSLGHQAAQTVFGAGNGLLAGIPGHFFHGLDTPEQRAARAAGGIQSQIGSTLSNDAAMFRGTDRLTHQIVDLQRIAGTVQDRQTQASQQLLASINQEIAARKNVIAQMNTQARQNAQSLDARIIQGLNSVYAKKGAAAARTAAFGQLERFTGSGAGARQHRYDIGEALLRAFPNDPAVARRIQAFDQSQGQRVRISNGGIYSGTQTERDVLKTNANIPGANLGRIKQNMVASLVAYGLTPAAARAAVDAWFARGMKGSLLPQAATAPGWTRTPGGMVVPLPPGIKKLAGGGRVPGRGMNDTVPVGGGLAAPGELIVNRHTERRVNSMLAPMGASLGGMVDRETRPHSARFATGGRVNWYGHPPLSGGIATIAGSLEQAFPQLQITATTNGNHVKGSYHYKGEAIDVGGSDSAMRSAAGWLGAKYGGSLIEGIHNPNLSIKNGKVVPASFWGASTWAGHANHIHIAAAGASAVPVTGGAGAGPRGTTGGGGGVATPTGRSIRNLTGLSRAANAQNALMGLTGGTVGSGGGGASSTPSGGGGGGGGTPISGDGAAFARGLAAATGLDPRVTAAWVRRENNGGGAFNWLNVSKGPGGRGYSGVAESAGKIPQFASFNNPTDALTETAWWINHMSNYAGIKNSARMSVQAQIGAIQASPWDAAHYPGGLKLARGGRTPRWGGWKAGGVNGVYSTPTVIGVGERGAEHVKVTPAGKGGGGAQIHATFHITGGAPGEVQREVEAALLTLAQHLDNHPIDGED